MCELPWNIEMWPVFLCVFIHLLRSSCLRAPPACLIMYNVFFDRSGCSSMFACLEHGINCQILACSRECIGFHLAMGKRFLSVIAGSGIC